MEELKFKSVNVDVKALNEQYENSRKPINDTQNVTKLSFNPKNYLDLKLKEHEATKTVKVRFLPISSTDGTVFFSIITHSLKVDKEVAKSGFKTYVCLNDEKAESNEECPICKKSKELFDKTAQARKEGNEVLSKSLFKEACSLNYICIISSRFLKDSSHIFNCLLCLGLNPYCLNSACCGIDGYLT